MKTITFFEIKKSEAKYLEGKIKGYKLKFFEEPLNEKTAAKAKGSDAVSVFIYSKVDKKVIDKIPTLKAIATRSTGYDHVDLKTCKTKKIRVFNVPYYGENTVAEHTMALILSLSRNIHKSYVRTQKNDYSVEGLTGFDLKDKTIGIIGAGHIGLHVARMARAFGMHVRVYDKVINNFLAEVVNFKYLDLDELLKVSDIISIHTPLTEHTKHLINKDNIKTIKKGAIIINTARGGIIDTNALYEALKSKRIAGAGLDVIEGEGLIKEEHILVREKVHGEKWEELVRNHKIFQMDNVVFTPHNAFNSAEAIHRILDTTIINLEGFFEDELQNVIL